MDLKAFVRRGDIKHEIVTSSFTATDLCCLNQRLLFYVNVREVISLLLAAFSIGISILPVLSWISVSVP